MQLGDQNREELLAAVTDNPFLRLHDEFSSSYKISKFVKNSGKYIAPTEVKLPPNSEGVVRTFQYIPIIELVTAIASEPGFKRDAQSPVNSGLLRDIKDASSYRNNPFFKDNPDALGIILYSDEVEICNPLSASKGVHKILNIYIYDTS
jgi:hypothetical protein